jgi:hypothetical protein
MVKGALEFSEHETSNRTGEFASNPKVSNLKLMKTTSKNACDVIEDQEEVLLSSGTRRSSRLD